MRQLLMSVRKVDITPSGPVSLLGYFNKRVSTGVSDPLFCRIASFRLEGSAGEERVLFIGIDTCCILKDDADGIGREIEKTCGIPRGRIMVFATHTHTAPALARFFDTEKESEYLRELKYKIVDTVRNLGDEFQATMKVSRVSYEGLSFNRRWQMKDGSVLTNPPKCSPLMEKPEGPVDRELITVEFFDRGARERPPKALFVNLSNHTDTVGGTRVSADWPGFMERKVNAGLKPLYIDVKAMKKIEKIPAGASTAGEIPEVETPEGAPPLFTLLAPQGNINHFEFDSPRNQTGYAEAERLGSAYASIVLRSLARSRTLRVDALDCVFREVAIPPREVAESELEKARESVNRTPHAEARRDLTAEDMARNDPFVEYVFARELLEFSRIRPGSYAVPLQTVRVGPLVFCGIPGEPFAEIGLALKGMGSAETIIPVALANGYFGYIPGEESFDRGGYEVKPSEGNCLARTAAGVILREFEKILR